MMEPTLHRKAALVFDLDGTLVDSVYQHVLAWREALETEGIELSVWRIHRRICQCQSVDGQYPHPYQMPSPNHESAVSDTVASCHRRVRLHTPSHAVESDPQRVEHEEADV